MYRVIKSFVDLQDNDHLYAEGDTYPRAGLIVTDKRISELSGIRNRQHTPLIVEGREPVKAEPKETARKGAKK